MALKVINLGSAALLGKDGDSNRIANTKNNANHAEIFTALGADEQGNLPAALPYENGGTGATTLAKAKENLGIEAVNLALTTLSQSINLALSGKEPTLAVGTATQFYRGDKTWQTLDKSAVGLGNADNTTDAMKPISTATQLALNDKANKNDITAIAKGGTGAITAEEARANLGAAGLGYNNFYGTQVVRDIAAVARYEYGTYGVIQWVDDSNFYFLLTDENDRTGPFNGKRPFILNLQSGAIGIDILNLNTPLGLASGGTGSNGAWGARNNLGLTGGVEFTSVQGAMNVGAMALCNMSPTDDVANKPTFIDFRDRIASLGVAATGSVALSDYQAHGFASEWATFISARHRGGVATKDGTSYGFALIETGMSSTAPPDLRIVKQSNSWSNMYRIRTEANTTVDGNGFIKAASPIVNLYADRIEPNIEAQRQEPSFEKLGVGNYLIKNTLGFAKSGWYVEQPKDANGNIYHAVEYTTLDNGDISIKTCEQKIESGRVIADLTKPVDIKESRFITIRLDELPYPVDEMAAPDPTILDDEGNPAPSRFHTLEGGVWTISEEDSAKLEQERLAAMQPLKRRQFRLTLAMNGYDLKEVESLIDGIEDPMQRTIAQIEWQDATDFERTNPTLIKMAELMGLTTAQVDSLWTFGLSL